MKRKLLTIGLPVTVAALIVGIGIASAASGVPGAGGPGGRFGFGGGFNSVSPTTFAANQATRFQDEATALGLNVSVITDGWSKGENLMQIATANGISTSTLATDLKTYRQNQRTAQLQALVANGTITQAQMDARIAFEKTQVANRQGGRGHWFRGPPVAGATPAATTTQ